MIRSMIYNKPKPELLSPGITLDPIKPGGRLGPEREVLREIPGGQTWADFWELGYESDKFQSQIADIRMPPNQLWPLHWHDCWIVVLVLDGSCIVGDWWMHEGDVMVTAAEVEYGPLLSGPSGSQIFEIFAQKHLAPGGYANEYHDHPTLEMPHVPFIFKERAAQNRLNTGNQVLKNEGAHGIVTGNLSGGGRWDLGDPDDPDRGLMISTDLKPGEIIPARSYQDWRSLFVLQGNVQLGGRTLAKCDTIVIEPKAKIAEIKAGPEGARLFEITRTTAGDIPA